ncbi:MAG: UDP-N-acetylglucosamine 1-carboxyvinyltransferase [Lysobacterales bacterium]
MDVMHIRGGIPLNGSVATSGAKNAALPLLFATLLAEGEHTFENVPNLKDIDSTELLLNHLNCKTVRNGTQLKVYVKRPENIVAPYDIVRKMRASILCLGPLLARYGEAKVSLPGGCAIGSRPINLHIEPLRQLGAQIEIENGYVIARAKKLMGDRIVFDFATVGGTENIMMAACLCSGTTIMENVAKEPEIVDLARCLRGMGAKIEGEGSSVITIEGVEELQPARHTVIPDRIEAGTLLIAGAITGGDVKVTHCVPKDIDSLINKLVDCGFEIETGADWVRVKPCSQWSAIDVDTAPHPGFPTDLQAQFMALMTQASGTSVITERIFENRFMHVQELARMGANITPKSQVAVVRGKKGGLSGAPVMATDLRASACLILAAMATQGQTTVARIYHLDRGYEKLEVKLQGLGAHIERCAV